MLMTLTIAITTRPLTMSPRAAEAGDGDALDHDGGQHAESRSRDIGARPTAAVPLRPITSGK